MKQTRARLSAMLLLAAVLGAGTASAWDSVPRNGVRNFRRNTLAPSTDNFSDTHHLVLQITKDRIGGTEAGGSDDTGVGSLVTCPENFDETHDFSACQLASQADLPDDKGIVNTHALWGWLAVRLAADRETLSEHYLIARESAYRAGLLSPAMTLFDPFFVRYATQNQRLASPIDVDSDGARISTSRIIVGQSWLPTNFGQAEAHALRSVSLLELAQLPDFSNNLADWAGGNEVCTVGGLEGAFSADIPAVEACHRFEMTMGALNVTHFAPLNREMWRHYHQLALTRAEGCKALDVLKAPFYSRWENSGTYVSMSSAMTEAHECEIEAMSYEMFAQHFMQDAWSTGHMWKRFGYPQLAQFPADVILDSDANPPDLSALSDNARRAAIALTTGVIAGEIHGAKAMIEKKVRSLGLNIPEVDDDPLNAPTYRSLFGVLLKDTQWSSVDGISSGGGDLFWWPTTGPSIYIDNNFLVQREGLLNCTAASMLEVYNRGSRVHGAVGDQQQVGALLSTVPDSDACWKNYATNEAMSAAIGLNLPALYYISPLGSSALRQIATGAINSFVLKTVKASFGFPRDDPSDTSQAHATAISQRNLFVQRLGDKMSDDARRMRALYDYNEDRSPFGSESARGVESQTDGSACSPSANCPITAFGVPPMPDAPSVPDAPRGVDYVDSLVSQTDISTDVLAPSSQFSMSRLFWRGNIPRTCLISGSNDFVNVLTLQAKCVAAASEFGDADACTQCIALAEPHVPNCGNAPSDTVGASKCSALGSEPSTSGMPAMWFDNAARWGSSACNDAYSVAFTWCTGTQGETPTATTPAIWDSETYPICNGSPPSLPYGTFRYSLATELDEDEGSFNTASWVFPVSTVRREWTTFTPGSDPCDVAEFTVDNSFDSVVSKEIYPATLGNYNDQYLAGPRYPRCGVLQKRWWANETCASAGSDVGFTPSNLGFFSPSTGEESYQTAVGATPYCMLREPRRFHPTCSNGATCNAGGECVSGSVPEIKFLSTPLP